MTAGSIPVYIEVGTKRVFASALDWLGWTRSGKDEKAALEALAAYAPRYAPVAKLARFPLPGSASPSFSVVERVKGNATTDFGAPAIPSTADTNKLSEAEAERVCSLLVASWTTFDRVAAKAPADPAKGPAWWRARPRQDHRPCPRRRVRLCAQDRAEAAPAHHRRHQSYQGVSGGHPDGHPRICRQRGSGNEVAAPLRGSPHRLACARSRLGDRRPQLAMVSAVTTA